MSGILLFATVVVTAPAQSADVERDQATPRPFHEIRKELRTLMKRESLAKSKAERAAAIRGLAKLYVEIKQDERLATATTLQRYKNRLWSRLNRVKKNLQQELARQSGQSLDDLQQQQHEQQHLQ